jgi:hypothetical protein
MSRATAVTALGILGLLALYGANAQPRPAAPLTVVELFTSQGCSSCPPADTLLGELARRDDVLALAYHVDYWDYLGWRDKFAIKESAIRQKRYVSTLGLSAGFTPQSVINGRFSVVGSDRRRLLAALDTGRKNLPINLHVTNGVLTVELGQHANDVQYDLQAIAYLPEAISFVGRGENAGRALKEFNIVRSLRRLGTWSGQAGTFSVPLSSLPPDASRVAIVLQQSGQGTIAGAASISLR